MVKSIFCSCRWPGFGSQDPHSCSQWPKVEFQGICYLFLYCTFMTNKHTFRQNTHTCKINLKSKHNDKSKIKSWWLCKLEVQILCHQLQNTIENLIASPCRDFILMPILWLRPMKVIQLARLWVIRQLRNFYIVKAKESKVHWSQSISSRFTIKSQEESSALFHLQQPSSKYQYFCFLIHQLSEKGKCKSGISLPSVKESWGQFSFIMIAIRPSRLEARVEYHYQTLKLLYN